MIVPSRFLVRLSTSLLAVALAACGGAGDNRLGQLSEGISLDSTLKIMAVDSANRTDSYLTGGQFIQALYFASPDAADSADFADRGMSPVVLIDGKLVAWGWERWDSIAGAHKIQVEPKN